MEWKVCNRFIHFYSSMRYIAWLIQYYSSFLCWFFRRIIVLFGVWNFSGFSWSLCRRWSSTKRISRNWFINLNKVQISMSHVNESYFHLRVSSLLLMVLPLMISLVIWLISQAMPLTCSLRVISDLRASSALLPNDRAILDQVILDRVFSDLEFWDREFCEEFYLWDSTD